MNHIDFDQNLGILYNAENAGVFRDFIIGDLIAQYDTTNVSVLLSKCGLSLNSGTVKVITTNTGHYRLQVTSSTAVIGISFAICGVKFNDRLGTYTYFGKGQNQSVINLSSGVYGFDELNILLNPNYLYRQNNSPYFYQLNASNISTSKSYNADGSSSITASYIRDLYGDITSTGKQYSMPNYHIHNQDIISVGLQESVTGSNPFKYNGNVFSTQSIKDTPPDYFCYRDIAPQVIFATGYVNANGGTCAGYALGSNSITVIGTRNGASQNISYPIDNNHKLVKYYRTSNNFTVTTYTKKGKKETYYSFVPPDYFHLSNNSYYDYDFWLFGERKRDDNSVIPLNVIYTIPMRVQEYINGQFVDNTNELYKTIVKTNYLTQTYNTPSTNGDGAPGGREMSVTIGRSDMGDSKKYITRYSITLEGHIDEVVGLPVNLPPSNSSQGKTLPYVGTISGASADETIVNPKPNNPPDSDPSFKIAIVQKAHIGIGSIKGEYQINPDISNHSIATVPNKIKIAQMQRKYTYYNEYDETTYTRICHNGQTNYGFNYHTYNGNYWYERMCGDGDMLIFDDIDIRASGYYDNAANRRKKINCADANLGTNVIETYEVFVLGRKDGYLNPYDD